MKKLTIGTISENELLELAETIKLKGKLIAERKTIASNIKEKGRASCFISFFAHGFSRDLCEEQGDATVGQLLQTASNKESEFILDKVYDSAISDLEIAISAYRDAEPEPKPKVLDQSAFDGLDAKWRFAAVDSNGNGFLFVEKPSRACSYWQNSNCSDYHRIRGGKFDASGWQNSLIERENVELTGSDLCRAMLERGDKWVLCLAANHPSNIDYDQIPDVVTEYISKGFRAGHCHWMYVVPVNSQGEPLTQSEVGL